MTTRIRSNPLPAWQVQTIAWSALSLTASGLLWLLVLHRRGPDGLPATSEPWLARWHGLSSMAAIFAMGIVSARHLSLGWALQERRLSGTGVCVLFALLALSGFALAYLVPEQWHAQLGWAHSALGVGAFALGAAHRR